MSARPRRAWCIAAAVCSAVLGCAVLTGCAGTVEPRPAVSVSDSRPPAASVSIASDAVTLRMLGFTNGPLDEFSIPMAAVVTDRVDQPNAVTLVMSAPSSSELASYFRHALPAAGFRITADDPATDTLTFDGNGWTGVLTGSDGTTAVALRPA